MRHHHSSLFLTAAAAVCLAATGCNLLVPCAPTPTDSSGICDPTKPACDGGPPEPVVDTRNDEAVGITAFAPNAIPAGVVLSVPNEGRLHVLQSDPRSYQSNPPASGPHFDTPAPTGFYCSPLDTGFWVHSLEHGYVVVLFDDSSRDCASLLRTTLASLLVVAPPSPAFGNQKLVITPYPGLQHQICVVAWNRQLFLDAPDLGRILAFYSTYIDQGPEQEQ